MIQSRVKNFMFRVLCGFFIGISVVAPGVSGSIMAVMMGIYRDLINIVSNPFKNFKKNFFYLLPMGIGALISLVLFVTILSYSFDKYPVQSQFLFIGLIGGSLVEVVKQTRKVTFKRHYIIGIVIAFVIALAMGLLGNIESSLYVESVSLWYLFLVGGVAGVVSIVPGMSVSLILMLFGVYDFLLHTASRITSDIGHFFSVAIPVGIFFVIGMVAFSNLIKFVFNRYPGFAYSMVLGFMCGTLIAVLLPAIPKVTGGDWIMCGVLLILGLSISVGFQFLGKKFNADSHDT